MRYPVIDLPAGDMSGNLLAGELAKCDPNLRPVIRLEAGTHVIRPEYITRPISGFIGAGSMLTYIDGPPLTFTDPRELHIADVCFRDGITVQRRDDGHSANGLVIERVKIMPKPGVEPEAFTAINNYGCENATIRDVSVVGEFEAPLLLASEAGSKWYGTCSRGIVENFTYTGCEYGIQLYGAVTDWRINVWGRPKLGKPPVEMHDRDGRSPRRNEIVWNADGGPLPEPLVTPGNRVIWGYDPKHWAETEPVDDQGAR